MFYLIDKYGRLLFCPLNCTSQIYNHKFIFQNILQLFFNFFQNFSKNQKSRVLQTNDA